MKMFTLNETMDQFALANGVCWYSHVFMREDGHILRMSLQFDFGDGSKEEMENKRYVGEAGGG